MKVYCAMPTAPEFPWLPKETHEGERCEMEYWPGQDGFWCPGCGYFLERWEAEFAIPKPYDQLDGLGWAVLDAKPAVICTPNGLTCEFPRW